MEKKYVKVDKGVWDVDLNIQKDQWKALLRDRHIFGDNALEMIRIWFSEPNHRATNKAMMDRYCPTHSRTPYNGVIKALGVKILKELNVDAIFDRAGKKCYYIIPFKGYREIKKGAEYFGWEMRPELVDAIEELRLFDGGALGPPVDNDLISVVADKEGKRLIYYSTRYERSAKNREAAILARGTICEACGFDFEKAYGKIGSGFIEVHHIKPLCSLDGEEIPINPKEDMVCVCANCHRMLHRHGDILTIEQLKKKMRSAIAGHKPRG